MVIVGELINTSRSSIREHVDKRDSGAIGDIARRQAEAGADYVDINCSEAQGGEAKAMKWLVENVQAAVDAPLCIDTTDPETMQVGLSLIRKGRPMANSISAEERRYEAMLPSILEHGALAVALCMDDHGVPETAADRVRIASHLVERLSQAGIAQQDIYLDLLVKPIGVSANDVAEVLSAARLIKEQFPDVHFICGLSNVSFGLPNRRVLNRAFMVQAMTAGIDSYLLDPLDAALMGYFYASRALLGQDPYCARYLAAHRKGLYRSI